MKTILTKADPRKIKHNAESGTLERTRELNLNNRIVASVVRILNWAKHSWCRLRLFKEKYHHNNNIDRVLKRDPTHNNSVYVDTLICISYYFACFVWIAEAGTLFLRLKVCCGYGSSSLQRNDFPHNKPWMEVSYRASLARKVESMWITFRMTYVILWCEMHLI